MRDPSQSVQDVIEDAKAHANALWNERRHRGTNLHPPDDDRVATEIARFQFWLGYWERELTAAITRSQLYIEQSQHTIGTIRAVYDSLQKEMDIATHRAAPTPVTASPA